MPAGARIAGAALLGPSLAADPVALRAGVEALIARAGADPRAAVLGELAVPAPIGSLAALSSVAAAPHEIAAAISDLGRVRSALEPLDLLLLIDPELLAGKRLRTESGELLVFGQPDDASELLVIDGWSEQARDQLLAATLVPQVLRAAPYGVLLSTWPETRFAVRDVPRAGLRLSRRYQVATTRTGERRLWISHEYQHGIGGLGSGVAADRLFTSGNVR